MITSDVQFPVIVQTQRGNIPIDNLNVGDVVYSYESGRELEILGFTNYDENIYKVEYNDGRFSYNTGRELDRMKNMSISQNYIDYNKKKIVNPLYPDPYIAGALLIYGDQTDPYLNLTTDNSNINNFFSNKYQLNYADEVSDNGKSYFRYNGDSVDKKITWEEFFSNYVLLGRQENTKDSSIVPLEYHRSSISDRLKFLRGVFDMGYDKELFPNGCGIAHTSKDNLLEVQKILWSLGILSTITYDQTVPCLMKVDKISTDTPMLIDDRVIVNVNIEFKIPENYKGRDYRLYILGKQSNYPGFFYNVDSIENMIGNSYKTQKYLKFKLQIKSVKFQSKVRATNILLNKPYVAYLTDNFLPKISEHK